VRGEARGGGCQITEVAPGSAADQAGLRVGDVITALDGDRVTDLPSLTRAVRSKAVGDRVVIEFTRDETSYRVEAVLSKRRE
jgi:putative serine protease PepD